MIFEITRQHTKGRLKTFKVDYTLEQLRDRLNRDLRILIVREVVEGKSEDPIVWKLNTDKILSQAGSWQHLQKYSVSTKSIMKVKRESLTVIENK